MYTKKGRSNSLFAVEEEQGECVQERLALLLGQDLAHEHRVQALSIISQLLEGRVEKEVLVHLLSQFPVADLLRYLFQDVAHVFHGDHWVTQEEELITKREVLKHCNK